MLVNFRFENFLSFDELTTFSMAPGKSRQHMEDLIGLDLYNNQNLLKISTIYGANASGKSSFVDAIGISKSLIIRGFHERMVLSNSYNKNTEDNSLRETKFEYEIVIGEKVYSYGFSVILSLKMFMSEWLYDITDEEKLIYTLDRKNNLYDIKSHVSPDCVRYTFTLPIRSPSFLFFFLLPLFSALQYLQVLLHFVLVPHKHLLLLYLHHMKLL